MDIWNLAEGPLQLWLLFAIRAMSFLLTSPIFSARFVPVQFRIYLAFLLAVIAYSNWAPVSVHSVLAPGDFAFAAISEALLGICLGLILSLALLAFQFAGSLAGYQMGLSIVNVLDPSSQQQVSLLGDFFFVCATMAFLKLNLHHGLLWFWHDSFRLAPPGAVLLQAGPSTEGLVIACITDLLKLGLAIAMPMLLFLVLMDAVLGILARVVPQLNIFFIGTTAKTALGLILLSLLVLQFGAVLEKAQRKASGYASDLVGLSATGPDEARND